MIKCFWTSTQTMELQDFCKANHIPQMVESFVLSTIKILDENYGIGRKKEDDGGYIAILLQDDSKGTEELYEELLQKHKIDREWCEFSDELCVDNTKIYQADLYITSTEYAVTIVWIHKERTKK